MINKIEKIEKFVQDMRCEVADLKADAAKKSFYTAYQSLVRSDVYLASIQGYIQKVKDEEEMKEEIIKAIEAIRQTGKYKVHDHICLEMIYVVNQMDKFDPYIFRQELNKLRPEVRKLSALTETYNAIKLCDWINNEVYRVQNKYKNG